jgi:HK97 family phage portal protein
MRKPYIPKRRESKSAVSAMETKSFGGSYETDDLPQLFGYGMCNKYGFRTLSNIMAWRYYESVAPVMNAVDIRTDNFAQSIKPKLLDMETMEFISTPQPGIPETQILELFANPNADKTTTDLLEAQSKSYEVTGDMYTRIKAINDTRPPVEIAYINPTRVSPQEDIKGGVASYDIVEDGVITKYTKHIIEGRSRYFTRDMMWELDHMKRFNPHSSSGNSDSIDGLSPYSALFYQIEQYISANIHNWATLDQGASPSAAITFDKDYTITDEVYQRLQKQAREKLQGADNAGNVMFIDGGRDIKMLSINNKDMDFIKGIELDVKQIYRNRQIPISFIDGDSKFTNAQEAKAQLFDMAIFPFADRYFEEMNRFLMPRYDPKGKGRYKLWYDERDVKAMLIARLNEAKLEKDVGVSTENEIRGMIGREEIDNGDVLLVDGSKMTLEQVVAGVAPQEVVEAKSMNRDDFIKLMKKQVDGKGKRMYSDVYIMKHANEMHDLT